MMPASEARIEKLRNPDERRGAIANFLAGTQQILSVARLIYCPCAPFGGISVGHSLS